jgi:hypothetical protein
MLSRFVTVGCGRLTGVGMLFKQHDDVQLTAPSSNWVVEDPKHPAQSTLDIMLGIRTTQDSGHRNMHEDVSEHPLELRLRTMTTNLPKRVPGMDLVVAFDKYAIRQERIKIADRKVRLSVSVFSRKRLIAKIVGIMLVIGIYFDPIHPNRL